MASLDIKGKGKLGQKYYGPFQVIERVGDVAYKLLHDIFHVELLRNYAVTLQQRWPLYHQFAMPGRAWNLWRW
jgi:hypothetical protein